MAGEPGTVLRQRVGSHAIRACLDQMWKECKAHASPVVAMYGNAADSLAIPPPSLLESSLHLDRLTHKEVDGCERIIAALLVTFCTSAWIMGKLPVSGAREQGVQGLICAIPSRHICNLSLLPC